MKIGVIGLGNIFQKAYLPVLAENRGQHTFYFASKNEVIKDRLATDYGFQEIYDSLDELLDLGIEACFIHSATVAHYELVKKCLLANIHVYIDKPLSETFGETEELLQLAKDKKLILMLGFNRRFAPTTQKLKALHNKRVIYLEKNRVRNQYSSAFAYYDLFLHLIDTAVYLLGSDEVKIIGSTIIENDYLEYVTLQLAAGETTAFLTMDIQSGANSEICRVTTGDGIYTVTNLTEMSHQQGSDIKQLNVSDWQTILAKRGFESMVLAFLEGIRNHDQSALKQEHVLLSHEICHQLISEQQGL